MAATAQSPTFEKSYTLFCLDDGQRTQYIVDQVAHSACPILIVGEAGTGKRNIAERIHDASSQAGRRFVVIDCATASASELQGALTSGGTIYLRSLAQLKPALQSVLLSPASGRRTPRLIASSRYPLADAVRVGGIGEDFFYSIAGITLQTVPLRHRRSEIVAIAEQMLAQAAIELAKPRPVLNEELKQLLLHYSWPGNLTELDSAMKACVLIGDQEFALGAIRASMNKHRTPKSGASLKEVSKVASMRAERELISQVLYATGGNRKQAAKELKISYKALLYKLKQIGREPVNGAANGDMS
ncbi:MAG: sigma-54-dependent Fis family transcriptional regulator [Acidobacteriales bacterium]|nr:sigma-54-dependent Fis family transcriptional regulator [Terriglobales bacterium]